MRCSWLDIIKSLNGPQMAIFLNKTGADIHAMRSALQSAYGVNMEMQLFPEQRAGMAVLGESRLDSLYQPGLYLASALIFDAAITKGYVLAQNPNDAEQLFRNACMYDNKIPMDVSVIKTDDHPVALNDSLLAIHGDWEKSAIPPLLIMDKGRNRIKPITEYTDKNEPQIWISLSDRTSLEITLESAGLLPSGYFYSVRHHCSEKEFENNAYAETMGVMATYTAHDMAGLQKTVMVLLTTLATKDIYPVTENP